MDPEARQEFARFLKLKTEIDDAFESASASALADALEPAPPATNSLHASQLDDALRTHNALSLRVEQMDVGDLGSLRKLAKASSDKEMHKEDTDLVELTLQTLFAFDRLKKLLKQRSAMLNMHSLRLQWEDERQKMHREESVLREELHKFIIKSRWKTPPDLETPRKRYPSPLASKQFPVRQRISSSSSNSSLMARRMRHDVLSLETARLSQRLHSIVHVALKQTGKTLDRIIDTSLTSIPDSFLDEQEGDEDRLNALNNGTVAFCQSLSKQWKAADEIAMAGQDVIAISDSTQREAESEILKRPSRAHLEHYQSLLDGHAKSLSLLRGKIHDPAQLPQPVHTLVAPDQSEKNDELVYTLERLTEKASRQLTLAEDAVARYRQAVDTLDQAQNLRADVDTAFVALQALLRLLSQQARITPPQRGKDVLDVSDSVEEQKLHQLWQALNKENQTSPKMLESGSKNLESLRTIGVDPNFVCDMSNLLVAFRAETVIAKRVSEDIQARLERIQEGRRIGAKSAELLSLMEKGRNQVTAFIHQKLWREDWQETPDECEVELPKEQTSQLKQSIRQLSDAAQHFDWPGLQAVCEERLAAIDAAMIFLAQLLEVHKNARDQSIATVQQLQSAEEICVTIDQTMTDMSLATDERFTFLESSAQNYLNSITHAVSFIASPVRLDGLPDLVQHDASVRKALNTASSRVASASHRLQHHRRRLSLKSELDCIARDVATLSSSVETNHRGVELLRGALEKTDRESSKLKNLMDELPSTADLQPLRRRSQSLLKGLQSLPDDTGDFEDLSNYRNSMIHRLHDLVTKIEDSEVSLQSLTQAVLHFLSEDDARRATERINRERDAKEQREAERRHGEWEKAWQANMDQIDRIGRDLAASSPPADRVEQSESAIEAAIASIIQEIERVQDVDNQTRKVGVSIKRLDGESQCEPRWPPQTSGQIQQAFAKMQELDQRRNALLHDLHELKSSATSRLDSVTRQRHLDTMKHQVAVAVANAQKALDQLEAVLSSTSPPSSEGSSIIEELNGTRHSAEAAIGSAEQTLNDCRYQSKSLKEDSIALFNSMISEEEEHLRTQGDRSKHLYQRIDAIRLHSDDLAIAQEKHAAGATTVSPLKAEQVKQDCQDRVASVDSVQTSVEDRLHALAENLTALEDGVEHIQKQQRVKKQTNVLSRSLSASASSLGALSQSISEDLTQTERLISRSKHAGVLAPPGAFHLTSQLKTSTARHQEAAKQLYSTTQLGESSPDCKDLTCAPDPSTAGENSHLATDVFGSRTVWTDDIVVRWQERFAEFAELIADLEEVLKSGKCIEERDAEDLRKQIEELEEDIPPTTHYDVNHATVQGLLACVEKMGTVNHFLEKKKAADHALSHLLNSIDSFDNPDLAFDHHEARHRSDSRRELTEALGQATTAVDTMTNDALFLHHDASIVEESQRVMSTWTIMRDMAAEKLQHGSQIKDHSAALSPMRTSNHDIRADRPPSQISMASVASSRIPRMRSTADLRVSRSERRPRPASPSAASVLSEAPTNFTNTSLTTRITKSSTHSHLPRRNPQTTPRHMRTSTSSKTLHTPDFRRNLSTRSLSEKLEKPRYSPASKRAVDQEVARVVNSMNFKRSIPIRSSDDTFDQSGRYYIGNRIYFVRILRSRIVMVRVGGGWQELRAFLKTHFSHLLVDQGDVSVLVPRSPNTPRSASLSLSRKSDVSVGGSPDLLKILSSPLGGSPVQRIRSVT